MDGPRRGTRSPIWDGREGDDGLWRFSDLTFRCKGATDGWLDEQEARDRRSSAINRTVLFYGSAVGRGRGEAEEGGDGGGDTPSVGSAVAKQSTGSVVAYWGVRPQRSTWPTWLLFFWRIKEARPRGPRAVLGSYRI